MKFSDDKKPYRKKDESRGKDIVCYEHGKHIKPNCPSLKKKKGKYEKKKRALRLNHGVTLNANPVTRKKQIFV